MTASIPDSVLEAALHAVIAQRCERAYVHDLRNSMQGIYASTDVFSRLLANKTASTVAPDRVNEIARNAIKSHDASIAQAIKHLVLQNDAPEAVGVGAAVRAIASFLNNDATSRNVSMRATAEEVSVRARPSVLRLAMLAVTTSAIDSLNGGGELQLSAQAAGDVVSLEWALQRTQGAIETGALSLENPSLPEHWRQYALRSIVMRDGGTITSSLAGERCRIQLRYPIVAATTLPARE